MKIINPHAVIKDPEKNIFTLRQFDYDSILENVKKIVSPVEDIGFTIEEISLKESRFSSGELAQTIKEKIIIKILKGNSKLDLSIFIPKLVDDNYLYINGRQKIPIFQLFDIPIVTRGNTIKIRTNVAILTLSKSKSKEPPYIHLSFLGKKVPLSLMIIGYYGVEDTLEKFDIESDIELGSSNMYENLREDIKLYLDESIGYTEEDFVVEIGRHYAKYNTKSKGEDILYALDLIPKVDVLSMRFFENDVILEEVCSILKKRYIDDTLITNKRLRIFEYVILGKLSKHIFDLCFTNRTVRNPKFSINSTKILSDCNTSDIVQFNFSINPIEELTKLSRVSILGDDNFSRDNVPVHLRDINDSMFGRIDPVDTPDRDNCGIQESLVPNVGLDENLRFNNEVQEKLPISITTSFTPFLKNDDQTRLQMACSQMRQAIMLRDFDTPLISSGSEGLFTQYTQFVKMAKEDGEVLCVDKKYIVVQYQSGKIDVINVSYRPIYVEHLDYLTVYVETGDKFQKGDILAESNFCKDGNINIGRNILTGIMVYHGYNYEDSIAISDKLVKEDKLTSVHFKQISFDIPPDKILLSLEDGIYKPLPEPFDTIMPNQPYARLKTLTSKKPYSVFYKEKSLESHKKLLITEVNLYANEWNEEIPVYSNWVKNKLKTQADKARDLQKLLEEVLEPKEAKRIIKERELNKFEYTKKYKFKREALNGIHVEMYGIFQRPIQIGDKIANRHGNKGVISKIVPHEKMPKLPDGRHLEMCINPLGLISRMNIGQLFELHLAMATNNLKINIVNMCNENKPQKEIKKYLIDFIKIIDKTDGGWYLKQFKEQLPKEITPEFMKNFTIIQAPFQSCGLEEVTKAMEYTSAEFEYKIYDPVLEKYINNPITVGYLYFFRMVHIAEKKLSARGLGIYSRRTLQPLGGRKNKGGQRCGEQEKASLLAHDAVKNIHEFFTTKSDCIDLKNQYIRNYIDAGIIDDIQDIDTTPEIVKFLNSILTVTGIDLMK